MTISLTPNGTRGASIPKRVFRILNPPVIAIVRLLRGKGIRIAGLPLLLLTTVGARSGRTRTVPLLWIPDGEERWLVVASSGGMAAHPAWYVNMVKNPDKVWIEVTGRRRRVEPESLTGTEREAVWSRIKALAPVYRTYEQKTDRQIPVIRLAPAPSTSTGYH
jgi:deazaflavin-dependent oxidoreductase (nitroreductase family)